MTKKVFLGGTVNNSTWREELIPQLQIDYFNPVVKDWNETVQQEEIRQRQTCDFVLYVITSQMLGFYAIAEVVEDSNKRPNKTIFCYLEEGFGEHQTKSLKATARLVKENGAKVFTDLEEVAEYLNQQENNDKNLVSNIQQEDYEIIELTNQEQLSTEGQEVINLSNISQSQIFPNNQKSSFSALPLWLASMFCCGRK